MIWSQWSNYFIFMRYLTKITLSAKRTPHTRYIWSPFPEILDPPPDPPLGLDWLSLQNFGPDLDLNWLTHWCYCWVFRKLSHNNENISHNNKKLSNNNENISRYKEKLFYIHIITYFCSKKKHETIANSQGGFKFISSSGKSASRKTDYFACEQQRRRSACASSQSDHFFIHCLYNMVAKVATC